jgi:hypothetical protein
MHYFRVIAVAVACKHPAAYGVPANVLRILCHGTLSGGQHILNTMLHPLGLFSPLRWLRLRLRLWLQHTI